MKRILLLTIFVLVCCFGGFSQERQSVQDNKIDEYGKMSWKDEAKRLQSSVFIELKKHPDHKAVFLFYYKSNSEMNLIKLRQKKILKMFDDNKLSNNHLRFAVGKIDFYGTSIWLVPIEFDIPK